MENKLCVVSLVFPSNAPPAAAKMHFGDERERPPRRQIALVSGLIFVVLAAVSVCITAALYWNERRVQTALLQSSQRQHVTALGEGITADLQAIASDVMILAEGKALAALLDEDRPDAQVDRAEARAELGDEFRLFAARKGLYDQIRYIDDDGREIVRVNLGADGADLVSEENLQSKKDRYYFQNALALNRGKIYISPFDLNVENGRIEQPVKPTIRFATPVFDAAGRKRGVLVVNYLGRHLLDDLQRAAAGQTGSIMLLNADGYWLKGASPNEEWAFMYPQRRGQSFAAEHPLAWEEISARQQGQLRNAQGLFTYATVRPIGNIEQSVAPTESAAGYHWKLVSHVSPEALAARSSRVLSSILSLLGGVAVLLALVSWLLGRSLVQQRDARRRLAERERLAAIGAAMTALAHESRNALQRSQSGLEMLARRLPPAGDAQHLLDEIQDAQHHLRDLYEQARHWASPLQPQPEDVAIGPLAKAVWEQLSHERNGRDDRLDIEPAAANLVGHVDRRMFAQVLRNIFENSLAAADPALIQLACADGAKSSGMIRIRVRDNGPGLSDEQSRRIFEPFFTTRTHGTGLGMAISRRIVEAHGGAIYVQHSNGSQHPGGTEIVVDLPRGTA